MIGSIVQINYLMSTHTQVHTTVQIDSQNLKKTGWIDTVTIRMASFWNEKYPSILQ